MNEKLAMEILKQVELQETTGCCEKCPRKNGTCIGCLDEAKNILINYTRQLQSNWNSLREWLEENYKDSQDIWYVKIINKMNELEGEDKK